MLSINGADKNSYDVTHTFFSELLLQRVDLQMMFFTLKNKKIFCKNINVSKNFLNHKYGVFTYYKVLNRFR